MPNSVTRFLGGIKQLFVQNWGLKLLAILLGLLTYYLIRGATSFEVPYNLPVVVNVGAGIAVLDQTPRTVDVTFRGAQESLRRLDQKQMRVVIRPTADSPAGSETVTISPRNIEGAREVRAVSIRPSRVTVSFDREIQKQVSVIKPKAVGRPLLGKVEVAYEPRAVTLRGPKRRLADVTSVSTEPVDVEGRMESFEKPVRVLSPGSSWVSEIDPPEVLVKVSIVMDTVDRLFTNVTVWAVTEPAAEVDVRFEPATVNVVLHGREEQIGGLAPDTVQAFVNCVGLGKSATYELPVQVHLPPETDVSTTVEPKTVQVFLTTRTKKTGP